MMRGFGVLFSSSTVFACSLSIPFNVMEESEFWKYRRGSTFTRKEFDLSSASPNKISEIRVRQATKSDRLIARLIDVAFLGIGYVALRYVLGVPRLVTLFVLGVLEMSRDVFFLRSPGKKFMNLFVWDDER